MNVMFVLCLALVLGVCNGFPLQEWEEWKLKYNKIYTTSEEEINHKQIWLEHYKIFLNHNSKHDRAYEMDLNAFSDQILPRSNIHLNSFVGGDELSGEVNYFAFAPTSWDWRDHGAITPVRNQGQLGDAVSIAATECVESYHLIHGGALTRLSTGEMHDCCTSQPVVSSDVFLCVHNIGGLCSMANYPAPSNICRNNSCTPVAMVNGGRQIPSGDEEALMENVYKMPALVLIDAGESSFQLYRSGVYSSADCSKTKLDHALQVVGYGTNDGQDYWICKNSWGASWGNEGYVWIARNKDNMCGIATSAFIPV